jgi:hydrogenase expression/formation protein HypD
VFFAIGFETTAPANAMAVWMAHKRRLSNFSVLVSHVLVPPAMTAILESPGNRVQGFLGPGHVCTVMGQQEYEPLARRHKVPIVITGFEPLDLLEGVYRIVKQLEEGRAEVENQYGRAVRPEGNPQARKLLDEVFEVCDRKWRGIGTIPRSGYRLRDEYREHDAEQRFAVADVRTDESPVCISGEVLRGIKKPHDCPAFGRECTPQSPLGATMVSSEGACAAYYAYGRHLHPLGVEQRVRNALDELGPRLRSHGGSVELLGVKDGVVRVLLNGNGDGCARQAVEEMVYSKAPEVVAIEVEGAAPPNGRATLPLLGG